MRENTRPSTGAAMDLVDLVLLVVLLGGVVLAVATLWACRGTKARPSVEEQVSPASSVASGEEYHSPGGRW